MKVKIEAISPSVCRLPFGNHGIEVTSESEEDKQYLENMWSRSAAAVMLTRNDEGSVTLTFAPTRPEC